MYLKITLQKIALSLICVPNVIVVVIPSNSSINNFKGTSHTVEEAGRH